MGERKRKESWNLLTSWHEPMMSWSINRRCLGPGISGKRLIPINFGLPLCLRFVVFVVQISTLFELLFGSCKNYLIIVIFFLLLGGATYCDITSVGQPGLCWRARTLRQSKKAWRASTSRESKRFKGKRFSSHVYGIHMNN